MALSIVFSNQSSNPLGRRINSLYLLGSFRTIKFLILDDYQFPNEDFYLFKEFYGSNSTRVLVATPFYTNCTMTLKMLLKNNNLKIILICSVQNFKLYDHFNESHILRDNHILINAKGKMYLTHKKKIIRINQKKLSIIPTEPPPFCNLVIFRKVNEKNSFNFVIEKSSIGLLKIYKKGTEKCHRDPSFDRISIKQINNRRSIKNHSSLTDQKLTRSITLVTAVSRTVRSGNLKWSSGQKSQEKHKLILI
ncbi:hypothetical protein BpHYR1_010167 [Brachionus plicatilis]|uniref:Uncharacterized protein n=1 Tax=Brachionus plicatilis TaxID=10195 RepID=A0A3M7QPN8_BRAPC|nr:hypothetical protein BpHYR1_010167 [Brachionus plicatilis]